MEWIGHDYHRIVRNHQFEQIEGNLHLTLGGDQNEKINGNISRDIAKDLQEKVGNKHALEAGTEIHHKAGKNVVIEAGESITLKAGGGFITIGPAGITISGVPVLINSGGVAGSGSGCFPEAAKLPKEADDGKPGKVGKAQKRKPNKIEPQTNSSVKVGEYQKPQGVASATAANNRQRELEASITKKRVTPTSMADAQNRLKQRRKELVKNGYKPKYTDEELLHLASKGEVNARYVVRIEWDKKPEEGLGYTRDSGRTPIWTTTFDQIEHADSDPELITNIMGFDQPFSPDDKFKMYIIDQGEDFETHSDLSIIPSYKKLGSFSKTELGSDRGFNADLVNKVMTPEYSERYAEHVENFKVQVVSPHMIFDKKEIERFTAFMGPEEKQMFKTRHLIHSELGANPLYAGNGLTKPLDGAATQSSYGALEVFTFQRKPTPTGELIEAGKLVKQPLTPLPKK